MQEFRQLRLGMMLPIRFLRNSAPIEVAVVAAISDLHAAADELSAADNTDAAAVRIAAEYALTAAFYTLFAEKMIRLGNAASAEANDAKTDR